MLRKLRITTLSSVVSAALGGGFFAFAAQDRRLEAGSIDAAASLHASAVDAAQEYSTCKSWREVVEGEKLRYAPVIRVSDPGTKDRPAYTGFWFYDGLQFDESGRFALAMKVDFHGARRDALRPRGDRLHRPSGRQ